MNPEQSKARLPFRCGLRRVLLHASAWLALVRLAAGDETAHWAFRPVVRPVPPAVRAGTAGGPIDAFIDAALAAKGLRPEPPADRATLLRRLYLVMLGLPPTPEEVDAFVADRRPDAFERRVDAVLADPRYGERWGRHWLDVARFAESNGFETNRERPNAWRFRDHVVAAFNGDTPYDRFVREQLAGDTLGADAATGFLVGGPVDIVKSPDPVLTAQQRADELDDMVSTTGTAFLGLTLGCARCHAHKFDPVSQAEYYAMTAIFSGVRHGDRALPRPAATEARLACIAERVGTLERSLTPFVVAPETDGALRPPVDFARNEETFPPVAARFLRFVILGTSGGEPCIDELEAWAGDRNVALASAGGRVSVSGTLPGFDIHRPEHLNDGRTGNARSWISDTPGAGRAEIAFAKTERIGRVVWGRDREGTYRDRLATRYRVEVAEEPGVWRTVASSDDRRPFGAAAPEEPRYEFSGRPGGEAARPLLRELRELRAERAVLAAAPMAYAGTFTEPEPAFRLHRGDPMQPREPVAPGAPAILGPMTLATNVADRDRRLALAGHIARPENPLAARVVVNRVWQHHFGVGLVETPNDFGRHGAPPSHPELLDWLASELVAEGWSLKALHRRVLLSAAWRRGSRPREDAMRIDADARLLWRFPSRRLEAEAIRDGILAVGGRLDRAAGGPSFALHEVERENVYHYRPRESFGPAESRRMVYALKVRMEQDGLFGAFDCPDGSLAIPRRGRATTPLQALNLFNGRFVIDESEAFAARLRREAGADPVRQVRRAWRLAFGREPTAEETDDAARLVSGHGAAALCRALFNANEFLFIP